MENYNDGKAKDIKTIDNIEQALKDFSEGSEALYDLLKFCYENGIETKACCKGHEGITSTPYIVFSNTAMQYMSNIEECLYYMNAEMSYTPKKDTFSASCAVYCKRNDEESSNTFFQNMKGILEATIENKETSVPKSIELIDSIHENISNSFFLNGKLMPSFTKNAKGNDEYTFTLLDPWAAIMVRSEDSTTLDFELEELDNYHIHPCQITMNIDGLSKYAEKVDNILGKRTNK